jgi:hypothetical protein
MAARSTFASQDIGGVQNQDNRRIIGDKQQAGDNGTADRGLGR